MLNESARHLRTLETVTIDTGAPVPSALPRLAIAVVISPVLAGIFVPIFHMVQSSGLPAGSLEGIDLTPFAQRDEMMLFLFACALFLFVIAVGVGVRPWRRRLTIMFAASAVALLAYAAVFAALFAG